MGARREQADRPAADGVGPGTEPGAPTGINEMMAVEPTGGPERTRLPAVCRGCQLCESGHTGRPKELGQTSAARTAAAAWSPLPYFRMFTARATTRIPTTSEIVSSAIIMSFAHGFIAETSVGLNAIEVLKDKCR